MDLRKAVDKLEWLRLQERDWRIRVRGSGYEHLRADITRAVAVREAYLRMAEAAMAYAEYQYDTGHGVLAWQQMVDYIGKRNKLWEEFVMARDKAITQQ
jgi:hypothetical protein